mgnify:CR=1 FL=1
MIVLLIMLAVIGLGAALLGWLSDRKGGAANIVKEGSSCATCSGSDSRCEQVCMMEAATKPIEYYDDEELDAYAGRMSDTYKDSEVEQFGEILYTMRPDEVAGWCRSLNLRGIALPDQLKDEVTMIINDEHT